MCLIGSIVMVSTQLLMIFTFHVFNLFKNVWDDLQAVLPSTWEYQPPTRLMGGKLFRDWRPETPKDCARLNATSNGGIYIYIYILKKTLHCYIRDHHSSISWGIFSIFWGSNHSGTIPTNGNGKPHFSSMSRALLISTKLFECWHAY